jgi:hypothetical protein
MTDALAKCTHCGFVHSVLHCDVGEGQAYDMARRIYADTLPQVLVDSDVDDAADWLAGNIPAGVAVAALGSVEGDDLNSCNPFEIDFKRAQAYFLAQKFSW